MKEDYYSISLLTSISMDFSIIVFNKLFDKSAVLIEDFITHVWDVVQYRLIFNLVTQDLFKSVL